MALPSLTVVLSIFFTVFFVGFFYIIVLGLRFYRKIKDLRAFAKTFPGEPPHWLWGNLHMFPGPNEIGLTWMKEVSKEEKDGYGLFWFGPFNFTLNVWQPETVKFILKTAEPKPLDFGGYFNIIPWLGDGLLLARGKKWERNRRLLTPAFHFDILKPYMHVNNQCTDILINKLEKFAEEDEYFEVFTNISQLTLDIVLRCAFSYDNDCQIKGESHPYVQAVNSLGEAVVERLLKPWMYPTVIFNRTSLGQRFNKDCQFVHDVADEIIQKRKETLKRQGVDEIKKSRYLDFLDILLTAKDSDGHGGLSDREIRDETDTFLFEGHDTTSSAISWCLYSLASHPEHQRLCQEEIDSVLRENDRLKEDIEWDDLPKLKYVTMCIKESLRHHTTVPFVQRQTTKDCTIDGRHVPSGTIIDIQLYVLHHSPEVWEEPEEYRPERFSVDNQETMHAFAFCPFSAGPRNCIGQNFAMHEMKTVIAKILSRFDLTLDPDREVKHRIGVVMKSEEGIFMKATPRNISK